MLSGLSPLVGLLQDMPAWLDLCAALGGGQNAQVFGLAGSLSALAVASLHQTGRPVLVISPGWIEARRLAAELGQLLGPDQVLLLPPRPMIHGALAAQGREWEHRRLEVLARLQSTAPLVVTPTEAARQLQIQAPPRPLRLARGVRADREQVIQGLQQWGYERLPMVEAPGQYAVRGAVMDVWPPERDAVRLEWFDDEVDLLAVLDPATQRTGESLMEVVVGPARELLWTVSELDRAVQRLSREVSAQVETLMGMAQLDRAREVQRRWDERLGLLMDGRGWPGMDRVAAAFRPLVPLTALFPEPPLVVLDDRERVLEAARGRGLEDDEERQRRLERGDLLPVECETTLSAEALLGALGGHAQISLSLLPHHRTHGQMVVSLAGRPAPRSHGQWEMLLTEIQRLRKSRHRVVVAVKNQEGQAHLIQRLVEAGVPVRPGLPQVGEVGLVIGQLSHGFVVPDIGLAVLTETELTGREVRPLDVPRTRSVSGQRLLKLSEIATGDYVVHVTHGIGQYLGVKTLDAGGQHKDYLHIQYAGADTLYVPVDQLDMVQRYTGVDDRPPKLSRLGGGEWGRVKERVKASVREMATELLKLYAARQARPGFAFGPDTPWQADFEAAFPYQETPDQVRAAREIKRDMEMGRPMDRLLLGDVGYGKTEVALRAAFKAIMAGKQVAVLVPTTLLAEQHFATARARMAGFPIRVEVLSRFRSPREQRAVLTGLADGQVDMVIGTHRLLSRDLAFKDLGLLVVDEEHRFGVAHKERIKQWKETVDVLTLSATPIPRTLHMTLVGVRDMSLIETPPEDRYPVETVVAEYDDDLIREAMRRELEREGQIYYVQNRIKAIDGVVARLRRMLPDLRIAVAHGRMDEDQLEEVMARFLAQEYDVLLATTIIESGLDIPNVNTLVVEDADRMGLAQLYQLRGRVGRSSRLAYAYFTVRPDRMVSPEAEQRLAAIRDFTELGSGYQIALRDLEIRGAGNLLGPEQHGFVAAVGFDLYTSLLAEAIAELKGVAAAPPPETALEFRVEAYLPDTYIEDARQKIALYKRMVSASRLDEVAELEDEVTERFGPMPEPVFELLRLTRIRVMARELGLAQVTHRGDRLVLRLSRHGDVKPEAVQALGQKYPGRLVQMPGKAPELGFRLGPSGPQDVLGTALDVLGVLKGAS